MDTLVETSGRHAGPLPLQPFVEIWHAPTESKYTCTTGDEDFIVYISSPLESCQVIPSTLRVESLAII